ncbi:MAG: response regulator transcription factor [Actinomycetota bacterium]
MRVLLVEDDDSVASGIADGLSDAGIDSSRVATAAAARIAMEVEHPALVLLDLGLPDADGTDLCRELRSAYDIPIIIVSARSDEVDRVIALELGADDYLVKPFGIRELVARVRAVMRRANASDAAVPAERTHGGLSIDARTRRVTLDRVEVHLTAKEFELLAYLAREPGTVFRRAEILHDVWDTNWYGTTKTLDTHVAAIRKKLGSPAWIESVRGIGFRFGVPA